MLTAPDLELVAAAAGLLVGAASAFLSPRVVAYRLTEPPPPPGPLLLLPLIGAWLAHWRPLRTVLLQVVMAAVFGALAFHYGASIKTVLAAAYSAWLLTIADLDLEHRLVLNRMSYPGTVLALAGAHFWPGFTVVNALLGAVVALLIFGILQFVGRGALGMGDTKLAVLIGAMRGLPTVLNALLLGVLIGGLAAAVLLLVLRRGRKEKFAYAPYLALGAVLSFFVSGP